MIRLNQLHKFYNKGRSNELHVINDVTLELPERGMVALFGRSGCGKTTLLNVIGGLDRFSEGSITVDEQSIRKDTDALRNRCIGYIFQNYNLLNDKTCYENVASALRLCGMREEEEIDRRVTAALAHVGMQKYKNRTPNTLSGGQQQRIAIARAIVKNPPVILADEPTGNLDEANTMLVMDLLHAIAKDRLVLLVTHEANLVDSYCDEVIELSDGRVTEVRHNAVAEGIAHRDRHHIYLGELEKQRTESPTVRVDYYGEPPTEPLCLSVVRRDGRLYLRVDSPDVQVLDSSSEVRLLEGSYTPTPATDEKEPKTIDMRALSPFEGAEYGRLFDLGGSIRSGYDACFRRRKRSQRLLGRCMLLFAAVFVLMSALFGTSLRDFGEVRDAYNPNVFYVLTPDATTATLLASAQEDPTSGIDGMRLESGYAPFECEIAFRVGGFETSAQSLFESDLQTNAVPLPLRQAQGKELLVGKDAPLEKTEILTTSRVADKLLEASSLGYLREYRDLLGLVSQGFYVDGQALRIAGIVRSEEPAVYLHELTMAKYSLSGFSNAYFAPASEYGISIAAGETVLLVRETRTDTAYPAVGETVKIHGADVRVSELIPKPTGYADWLSSRGIPKMDLAEYVQSRQPGGSVAEAGAMETYYYEYWIDYYYAEISEYLSFLRIFEPDVFESWAHLNCQSFEAALIFMEEDCFYAYEYRRLYGRYPTPQELVAERDSLPRVEERIDLLYQEYGDLFYREQHSYFSENRYLLSDADYIAVSSRMGETHPSACRPSSKQEEDSKWRDEWNRVYTVLHSADPRATEAWLSRTLSLEAGDSVSEAMITPGMLFDSLLSERIDGIVGELVTMGVLLGLMSLCMYFIMRSALMNRVKEVGIYRAIGVSRRNLVFRFLVESGVLTLLTVCVAFLLVSGFLMLGVATAPVLESFFFYPMWYALLVLGVLLLVSLLCGILPILLLLRRTPSEILAKYDI